MFSNHLLSLDCVYCGTEATEYCPGCVQVAYCSKECQRKHWKEEHKMHHMMQSVEESLADNYELDFVDDEGYAVYTTPLLLP